MRFRVWVGLSLGLLSVGCGDGGSQNSKGGGELTAGGTRSPCGDTPIETAIGWEDATPLGNSPREVFAAIAGSCESALSWDASGSGIEVEPAKAQGTMHVRVTIDEQSARLREPRPVSGFVDCQPSLAVDAELSLESDDGLFVEHERVQVAYWKTAGVGSLSFSRKASELGGSLQITTQANQEVTLTFEAGGAGGACAGQIQLWTTTALSAHSASGGGGPIGGWSHTTCPFGREEVRFDGSDARADSLEHAIASAWSDASYPGAWDDGSQANLQISVRPNAQIGCVETKGEHSMLIPVRLRYGSDDGRVAAHETDAHVYATFTDKQASILQVLLDETLTCAPQGVPFPYLRERCAELEKVQLQFAINHYTYQVGGSAGTALVLYKFAKGNTGSLADAVEHFTLR